jgi:hypothetical protein
MPHKAVNTSQNPTGADEATGVVSPNYSYIDSFRRAAAEK